MHRRFCIHVSAGARAFAELEKGREHSLRIHSRALVALKISFIPVDVSSGFPGAWSGILYGNYTFFLGGKQVENEKGWLLLCGGGCIG